MLYGLVGGDRKALATPKARGVCPSCGQVLIAKCGQIKVWHWAHKTGFDCDSWYEGESDWHLGWKKLVMPEFCEVVFGANREHRADIVGNNGVVVELQNSAISPVDIQEREKFYEDMIWLFNGKSFNIEVEICFKHIYHTWKVYGSAIPLYEYYRLKIPSLIDILYYIRRDEISFINVHHKRGRLFNCITKPLFIHVVNVIILVDQYSPYYCRAKKIYSEKEFMQKYLSDVLEF